MKRIVILGAGISGLSLGWFLKRRFGSRISLHILEKSNRPGGWIQTSRKDGFLFEQGPRSCRSTGSGVETLKLLEQLGMEEEVIVADPSSYYRYLWLNKKLRLLPTGPLSFLFSPLMWGVIPACIRDLFIRPSIDEDESIYHFIKRRFSPSIAEKLIDPLATGIYAGDIRKLSIKSCFPVLHEFEQQGGSVLRGMIKRRKKRKHYSSKFVQDIQKASIFSLKGGMEDLTDELACRLDDHIIYSSEVKAIHCSPMRAAVELENGTAFEANHIYSTIPAYSLALLFGNVHQEITKHLLAIPSVSVAIVSLGYHSKALKKKGFGYLIPSKEKEDILGVIWNSSVFPQQNQIPEETRLTVMIGGAHMSNFKDYSEENFLDIARNAINRHLGIDAEPDTSQVKAAHQAIPQYLVGYSSRVSNIKNILSRIFPKLTLHGNSFHGVSVNDCIANSKHLEETIKLEEI